MKKQELLETIASKTGESKKSINNILNCLTETIVEACKNGDNVDIYGFAKFEAVKQSERTFRNPKTGESKITPAKMVPKCRFKNNVKRQLAE